MSSGENLEQITLLPDRLSAAAFSDAEINRIKGRGSEEVREASAAGFNWLAAYLCEEIGYYESELVEWFRSPGRGLDWKTPLAVWAGADGPTEVFEYAQKTKEMIDEDLSQEPDEHWMARSHRLGSHALEVVQRGFLTAGVDTDALRKGLKDTRAYAIHSPKKDTGMSARWKSNGEMEDWRINLEDGLRRETYFVVRYFPPDGDPFIMQTGIGRSLKTDGIDSPIDIDTDMDGRPPTIGEVASFVIPFAGEVRSHSLAAVI